MLNDNFILIQGNTDEKLGTYSKDFEGILNKNVPVMANAYREDLQELTENDKDFLAKLPKNIIAVTGSSGKGTTALSWFTKKER